MLGELNPLDLPPGTMVQVWRIVRRIGRGGYAVVYEVENEGKRYALKLACQTERSLDPRQVDARAEREVACLQQLKHPHIIRMRAHGRWPDPSEGFLFIVLDYVDGFTLAQWSQQTGPTPREYAALFLKLFDAADYMHGKDVFHRDLSVNNIMVTKGGEPVIIDFGVADYATADQLTDGPIPPGTPRNRSPQAHRFWEEHRLTPGAHYVYTAADDIYALGADLYDLLTDPTPARNLDRPPLGGEVLEPPSPWRVTKGRVPADLSGFAMKLISPDLAVRYSVAKAAKRALEEFVGSEDPEWDAGSVHPARAQFPPERPGGAPVPVQARQPEGPREPPAVPAAGSAGPSLQPLPPVQEPPAMPPAGAALPSLQPPPVQEPPAVPPAGAAAPSLQPPPVQELPAVPPAGAAAPSLQPPPVQEPPAVPPAGAAAPSLQPPPVQEPPAVPPAGAAAPSLQPPPVQEPPAVPPAGAAALASPRRAWLRPKLAAPALALAALAALALAFLLYRPAPPQPPPVASPAPAEQPRASSTLAEKPTSRAEQLASRLPTQKEASPSVKQSDTSPTLTNGTPNAQQGQRASARRALIKKCATLVASVAWLEAGCTGVQTRPDPEDCPEDAVKAMRQELGWFLGGSTEVGILLDVTKGTVEEQRGQPPTVWKDGPVTGALIEADGNAPAGTRLDGHLWTTGDRIYGRYVRAHLPGGRVVPICLELGSDDYKPGIDKREGSKPGHTVGPRAGSGIAVERWR
ncbi:protein kinase [Stigmatella sp. ncwal1]|uniref:non-specific serine/threonine protein kinase n=1 Tax=Stigmatella ashevillensis TaxID=2995309 RepID=A0ABT5DDG7_9BACT|nr:serine/threonine-protein kinase [Stigmatella ashevillena]MDC0711720.1 protein kinase [Stigmatella ashevillena]